MPAFHSRLHAVRRVEVRPGVVLHAALRSRHGGPRVHHHHERHRAGPPQEHRLPHGDQDIKRPVRRGHCHHMGRQRPVGQPARHLQGVRDVQSFAGHVYSGVHGEVAGKQHERKHLQHLGVSGSVRFTPGYHFRRLHSDLE